ncbi:MAG: ABC-2 family transporter protein [Leptospiraceae bacterium]|nr:ABC-2 family transporter protein [Leptospiraceae bacterium]MCB1302963.1 ABC-2 family transporter protein [Leptospiraceae bacterium]
MSEWSSYKAMLRAAIQSKMEYRGSFIAYIFTLIGFYGAQVSVIALMLNRFHRMGGWNPGEVAFLYSLLLLCNGMVSAVFSGMTEFSELVREGTFDRVMLRPLSELGQILAMKFEPGGLAHMILGVAALIVANNMVDLDWTPLKGIFLLVSIVGGVLILASIRIIIASVSFFAIKNQGLQHLLVFSAREFLMYPVHIYSFPVRFLLTFMFPIAFVNFYPAHYFLAKQSETLFHPVLSYMSFPVGAMLLLLSLSFWRFGVNHYSSTGS